MHTAVFQVVFNVYLIKNCSKILILYDVCTHHTCLDHSTPYLVKLYLESLHMQGSKIFVLPPSLIRWGLTVLPSLAQMPELKWSAFLTSKTAGMTGMCHQGTPAIFSNDLIITAYKVKSTWAFSHWWCLSPSSQLMLL